MYSVTFIVERGGKAGEFNMEVDIGVFPSNVNENIEEKNLISDNPNTTITKYHITSDMKFSVVIAKHFNDFNKIFKTTARVIHATEGKNDKL